MGSDSGPEAAQYLRPREPGATVWISDPDPGWARAYAVEAARIRQALGEAVVDLHHVGSTSVPGLAAKPIIDIVLSVRVAADEPLYAPALQSAGYQFHLREPHWHEHRLFKRTDTSDPPGSVSADATSVNLHVFAAGCVETRRMLLFRDWLRAHPADRELYEQTKRSLAGQQWAYVQDYADAKSPVVAAIMRRALMPP